MIAMGNYIEVRLSTHDTIVVAMDTLADCPGYGLSKSSLSRYIHLVMVYRDGH